MLVRMSQHNARALGAEELILSHFSLAPMHDIEERVRLAAENDFSGIGLYVGQYIELEKSGFAPFGLEELLQQHNICLAEIEVVSGLGVDGQGGERAALFEAAAWRIADHFESRYLQVIGPGGEVSEAARAFGLLCDRAGDHGLVVGLEFLPFTDIVSVHDARRIVEAAGRSNGGICVDIWHHQRGACDLAAIADLPAELLTGVQMNDGTLLPETSDYYTDCLTQRRAPGAGEFDIAAVVQALRATGTQVPWSIEAPSTVGWANPEVHIAALATGMRKFM